MVLIVIIFVNNLNLYLKGQRDSRNQKIRANPGCEMNQKKVREICERATYVGPLDQVVVFMGGNT